MILQTAFLNAWKEHIAQNKPEYLKYVGMEPTFCEEEEDHYLEVAHDFIDSYIKTVLVTKENKEALINEYGFKKLIDLMCEYNGDEICDELLDFCNHMDSWLEMLMHNLLKIYT